MALINCWTRDFEIEIQSIHSLGRNIEQQHTPQFLRYNNRVVCSTEWSNYDVIVGYLAKPQRHTWLRL